MQKVKKITANFVLLILSLMVALLIGEITIRLLRPDIKNLVNSKFVSHRFRIFANSKSTINKVLHPDNGVHHLVIRNSLGLRQHREFKQQKQPGTVRVGVFGDSFTENLATPVEFSFTEPLDYLLNRTGKHYEVFNFGTDGYGPDQIYLQYLDEGTPLDLDIVIYCFYFNDLRDVLINRLFDVDEKGRLKYLPVKPTGTFIKIVRNFYLTYFLIESFARANITLDDLIHEEYDADKIELAKKRSPRASPYNEDFIEFRQLYRSGNSSSELKKALNIFTRLVVELKNEVTARNQRFYVVLVPDQKDRNKNIKTLLENAGIDVLDLYPVFEEQEQDFSSLFFKNDPHWNEEGNKIAAVYLYKLIARLQGLPYKDDDFIKTGLYEYYSSFDFPSVPFPISESWLMATDTPTSLKNTIRRKYRQLGVKDFE